MDARNLPVCDDNQADFPHRKKSGLDNDLMELLWQNGEVVLNCQNNKKPSYDLFKSKPFYRRSDNQVLENSSCLNQAGDETVSLIHSPYPVDDYFEEFCSNFVYDSNPEVNKSSGLFESCNLFKFGATNASNLESFEAQNDSQVITDTVKASNLEKREIFSEMKQGNTIDELSVMTFGSSHCGSNQVLSRTLPAGIGVNHVNKLNSPSEDYTEMESFEQDLTSSSGGSFCKTNHKRNIKEINLCDATELQSASGNKSSQKSGTTKRTRVAEVHNLSERRRRDRINEKMKALQELIPHSSKSDKASMLDDAIEYMKSLQSQIQFMWMGSGMAQMIHPNMQRYMPQIGMGLVPPLHNLLQMYQPMTVSPMSNQTAVGLRPMMNPVHYQNRMQNSGFDQQLPNYMNLFSMQNNSQPMNHFNFSPHSTQSSRDLATPRNVDGSNRGS